LTQAPAESKDFGGKKEGENSGGRWKMGWKMGGKRRRDQAVLGNTDGGPLTHDNGKFARSKFKQTSQLAGKADEE